MSKKIDIAFLQELFLLKLKFASSSLIATTVDYVIYLGLVYNGIKPTTSHIVAAGTGMIINFILQKKYIFLLNRPLSWAFGMSVLVSLGGIALGTFFIYELSKIDFFSSHQYITKLIVTGTIFFYNFYLKRFSFENKFF